MHPTASTPVRAALRASPFPSPAPSLALALASIVALAACQGTGSSGSSGSSKSEQGTGPGAASARPPAPAVPLRAEPTKVDLGQAPIQNPLNLYDIEIAGSPDHETVGTIDGVRVTTQDLESQSVGAFGRIAERLYQARDQGWRWLIERVALDEQARGAGMPLVPFLLADYGRLPAPTDAELAAVAGDPSLAELPADERRAAAATLWRMQAWQRRRSELILEARARLPFERVRRQISTPDYADPSTVVARLQDQPITRAELRVLAGYQAALARHEYWNIAKLQFDKYVEAFLLEREAQGVGVPVSDLERREIARMPPVTDAEVDKFMAESPEYKADPNGRERARDNVRRLREIDARQSLLTRLRAASDIRFLLEEPPFERTPVEVPAPRWHGPPDAPNVIVAFHAVGCPTCTRGSQLLLSVLQSRAGTFKLLAGDYFEGQDLAAYRGSLALH
ncbi:MAG TPA: thioredoxin domain-containing protein, partial [Haliangium sp.]|nr:thioredoxin domain-containing protein [Haliangium sp.]